MGGLVNSKDWGARTSVGDAVGGSVALFVIVTFGIAAGNGAVGGLAVGLLHYVELANRVHIRRRSSRRKRTVQVLDSLCCCRSHLVCVRKKMDLLTVGQLVYEASHTP